MPRYIDLDKTIEDVESVGAYYSEEETVKEMCLLEIKGQPIADVVEVVRCKDCVFCKYNTSSLMYKCDRRGYFTEKVEPSDFCSKGERKDNGT